jgi:hypothetical protein
LNNLFSINRAADLIEKDRATLVRALRHVPPEGYTKHGQTRWSMQTIRNALAVKPQARHATGKLVALIGAEPSLDKRRELALKLAATAFGADAARPTRTARASPSPFRGAT